MRSPLIFFPKEEVFVDITDDMVPNVKPYYSVSQYGNVYSNYSNKILKNNIDNKGYQYVNLATYNGSKNNRVHRLVMFSLDDEFRNRQDIYPVVNHLDGNPLNNNYWNLEKTDYKGNSIHAYQYGLVKNSGAKSTISIEDVHNICKLLEERIYTTKEISNITGISENIIYHIANGVSYPEISCNYDLKDRRVRNLSNESIHKMCKYFESVPRNNKKKWEYISDALIYNNLEVNQANLNTGERLLYKMAFKDITSQYNY